MAASAISSGIVLGFPGVQGVHQVSAHLVHRDLQAGPLVLLLVGHPLAGLHPVLGGHVHLGPVDAVHARADLQLPGHEALREAQAPQVAEHDAHIDAVRAEGAAAVAAGALGPGHVHAVAHVGVVHVAVLFDDLAQGGLNLVRRHLGRVAAVGQVEKAGVAHRAQWEQSSSQVRILDFMEAARVFFSFSLSMSRCCISS